jgi:hypothetical protein
VDSPRKALAHPQAIFSIFLSSQSSVSPGGRVRDFHSGGGHSYFVTIVTYTAYAAGAHDQVHTPCMRLSSRHRQPSQAGATRHRETTRRDRGIIAAVVGAITAALAGAVISGDWFDGSSEPDEEATSDPSGTIQMEAASDPSGAISVQVPEDWGFNPADHSTSYAGYIDSGVALKAGTGSAVSGGGLDFTNSNLYFGASATAADRLDMHDRPLGELRAWATSAVRALDWSLQGCSLSEELPFDKNGFVGVYRIWKDCSGFEGTRMYELFVVSSVGDTIVNVSLLASPSMNDDTAELILESFRVRPESLPTGPATEAPENYPQVPGPSWATSPTAGPGDL